MQSIANLLLLVITAVMIAACAQTGPVIGDSVCSTHYRLDRLEPLVAPNGTVRVRHESTVSFKQLGSAEDQVFIEVNGVPFSFGSDLTLPPGRSTVDFFVNGEGEVHYWHVRLQVDGRTVFEHKQDRLAPFSCGDELYRYRISFYVKS